MPSIRWVLLDLSEGAACTNGETLTPQGLADIAEAVTLQIQQDWCPLTGSEPTVRAGSSPTDIEPGESVYGFKKDIGAPSASAFHDKDGNGVPFALCAVPTCDSIISGPGSLSNDASHEILEADRDPGTNRLLDDQNGSVHADEACDAIEVQTCGKTLASGKVAQVSNFVLDAWRTPGGKPPYDYMSLKGLAGAVAPPGPMQTAPGNGGNYQITAPFQASAEGQVFAARAHELQVVGKMRKVMNWTSRSFRRLFGTHPVQLGHHKKGEPMPSAPAGWSHPSAQVILSLLPK